MSLNKSLKDGEYILFVSTESMAEKAVKMKKVCRELLSRMNRAESLVMSTDSFWNAPSADLMRESFKEEIRDSELLAKKLNETVRDLDAIISHYKYAEAENVNDAGGLPDSIIQ